MTTFVQTSEGWINLDHVILVRYSDPLPSGEPGETLIQLTDGRTFVCHVFGDITPKIDQLPTAAPVAQPPDLNTRFTVGSDYTIPTYRRDRLEVTPQPAEPPVAS